VKILFELRLAADVASVSAAVYAGAEPKARVAAINAYR
jgi:hypothetical protein